MEGEELADEWKTDLEQEERRRESLLQSLDGTNGRASIRRKIAKGQVKEGG